MKNRLAFRQLLVVFFSLLPLTCKQDDEFQKIREGNFDIVLKGRYEGRPIYAEPTEEETINSLRAHIEKNLDVLQIISDKYFGRSILFYNFKFAALDQEKNRLVLRYFARITDDPIYAGYQIQFVYDINSKRLIQIFTCEVPLE